MALPRSALPPYVNQSFVSSLPDNETMSTAQALFFRYHPAVLQNTILETTLKAAEFSAKTRAEQLEYLRNEQQRLSDLRARYRQSGAGPSGSAELAGRTGSVTGRGGGRGGGGRGGGGTDPTGRFLADMTNAENDRFELGLKAGQLVLDKMNELDRKPRQFVAFEEEILAGERTASRQGRSTPFNLPAVLVTKFGEVSARMGAAAEDADPYQRKNAATDLFLELQRLYPETYGVPGQPSLRPGSPQYQNTQLLAAAIDEIYKTSNFLSNSLSTANDPLRMMETERQRVRLSLEDMTRFDAGVAPGFFELEARRRVGGMSVQEKDTDGDGKVSPAEDAAALKKVMEQSRKELGIAEPLTDDELVLLDRYTRALADDGQATPEELGGADDFARAKAAYDKGRRVENLPRGYAPFYDDTYLNILSEESAVRRRLGELEAPTEDPFQEAARRATGDVALPVVPQEALDAAAAAGGPLAADALPFAIKRFTATAGSIDPQTPVERFAQRLIDADPMQRPSFQDFAAQVGKKYFDDPMKRREALAYYGAFFRAKDFSTDSLTDVAEEARNIDAALAAAVAEAPKGDFPVALRGRVEPGLREQALSDTLGAAGVSPAFRETFFTGLPPSLPSGPPSAETAVTTSTLSTTEGGEGGRGGIGDFRPEAGLFMQEAGAVPPTTTGLRPSTFVEQPPSPPPMTPLPRSNIAPTQSFLASPQTVPPSRSPVTPFTPPPPPLPSFLGQMAAGVGTMNSRIPSTSGVTAPGAVAPPPMYRAPTAPMGIDPVAEMRARAAVAAMREQQAMTVQEAQRAAADRQAAEEALLLLERAGL